SDSAGWRAADRSRAAGCVKPSARSTRPRRAWSGRSQERRSGPGSRSAASVTSYAHRARHAEARRRRSSELVEWADSRHVVDAPERASGARPLPVAVDRTDWRSGSYVGDSDTGNDEFWAAVRVREGSAP